MNAAAEAPASRRPAPLYALAERLRALPGWAALLLSFLLGTLAAGAMAPLHLVFLLIPAFAGLVWLLDGAKGWPGALLRGWAFGFGYFAVGLYWVGLSFLVEAEIYGFMAPFAVAGLSAGLALFVGFATAACRWLGWRGAERVLILAVAWVAAEWLRGVLLTGFPWNLIGGSWAFSDIMIQGASLIGVWGLGLITVFVGAACALLGDARWDGQRMAALGAGALLLVALAVFGLVRLQAAPDPGAAGEDRPALRLVQPSIPQTLKWRPELRARHVEEQIAMSRAPGFENRDLVIWAETAVPYLFEQTEGLRERLATAVPPGGRLIVGAPSRGTGEEGRERLTNSLFALDGAGQVTARYDKAHLVPFGEYMPLRGLAAMIGLKKVTGGRVDFTPGPGRVALDVAGAPTFSPLICYEVIFPGAVTPEGRRPGWLLNLTNDAWFGLSSGPYQHLTAARLRAVEEGLPLVRVANTGISAVIDARGRVVARLELEAEGIIDARLPEPLPATLFARMGYSVLAGLLLCAGILAALWRRWTPV